MGTATTDIVQKLWNLCTLLREDGVMYHQYVAELTYLLFLKTMKEQGREDGALRRDGGVARIDKVFEGLVAEALGAAQVALWRLA